MYFPPFPGMGGKFWAPPDERQLPAGQSNRPQPLPALWLPLMPPLLFQAHWPLPQGQCATYPAFRNFWEIPHNCISVLDMFVFLCCRWRRTALHHSLYMASYCGVSSSTLRRPITRASTRWMATPSAYASPGTKTQRRSPSGRRPRRAFPG